MRIIKEEILGSRGGWIVKARVVVYNLEKNFQRIEQRRTELLLEKVPNVAHQDVGWTTEDLAELHNSLVKWKQKIGEP
jgi:hypothetical protein